jgi:uncharacterized protein
VSALGSARHPRGGPAPRFLADVMLERLARWLRALGHDAASAGAEHDHALARRAADEGRWLLTRDRRLAEECRAAVLVRASAPLEQLREVVERFGLAPRDPFSRCLVCNEPLRAATAAEVEGALREVCERHRPEAPRACPRCGRVYWEGSHTRRMRAALRTVIEL